MYIIVIPTVCRNAWSDFNFKNNIQICHNIHVYMYTRNRGTILKPLLVN